jgi:hypothetical protein
MKLKYTVLLGALFAGVGHSTEKLPQKTVLKCTSKKNAIWTDEPRVQNENNTQFVFTITTQKIQLSRQYTDYSPPKIIWTKELEPVSYDNELKLDSTLLDVFRAKDSSVMLQMAIVPKTNQTLFTVTSFSSGILFIDSGTCTKD